MEDYNSTHITGELMSLYSIVSQILLIKYHSVINYNCSVKRFGERQAVGITDTSKKEKKILVINQETEKENYILIGDTT